MTICKICKNEFKRIGKHIQSIHKITLQEYYDKYEKVDNEDMCPVCGKKKKFGRDLNEGYSIYCSPRCAVSSKEVQTKMRETCLKNHGVENPLMDQEMKEKAMVAKYGQEYALQVDDIYDRVQQTVKDRYGVDHISKIDKIKNKKLQTMIQNYGCHYSKTIEAKRIFREKFIRDIIKKKGKYEEEFFNALQKETKYQIVRNNNIIGYFPDGYIEELNLIIEFDERYHNETWIQEHDHNREKELYQHLKCSFFRVREKNWIDNPLQVIEEFKRIILN